MFVFCFVNSILLCLTFPFCVGCSRDDKNGNNNNNDDTNNHDHSDTNDDNDT